MATNTKRARSGINELSTKIEDVLLLLLTDLENLQEKHDEEVALRSKETAELKAQLDKETKDLKEQLKQEIAEREKDKNNLQLQIDELSKHSQEERDALRQALVAEKKEREKQVQDLNDFFT